MFGLADEHLRLEILGCGDGPASFNAEATRRGGRVTSCDPIYRCSSDEIRRRIADTFDAIIEQTKRNAEQFVWTSIRSIDDLARAPDGGDDRLPQRLRRRQGGGPLRRRRASDAALRGSILRPGPLLAFSVSLHGAARHENSTSRPCARCVAWLPRCASFRSSRSTEGRPNWWPTSWTTSDTPVSARRSSRSRYEFQRGATQMMRISRQSTVDVD